jgi:phosphomannomutase
MAQLRKEGKDISSLTATLKEPVESKEVRFKITDADFKSTGNRIIKELEEYAETQEGWCVADDSREGVRVSFGKNDGDGWFLLRLSVHDPIMPLNIESDSQGGVEIILNKLMTFLKGCSGLEV